MINKEIKLINSLGLHARPCSMIAKEAMKFKADFLVKKGDEEVNGKSVINLMMLAAPMDTKLFLTADGGDEQELMKKIVELFNRKFDED
ncbi:MAG: HPr family phosphocarrier protein [Candidatus Cloacimonadota bacterium]|nr:HPr family phosphocarrier protein [Candidatus Cloacimonadota bacterium]